MSIKTVHSDNAPAAIGPYSQALVSNGFVFTSGQIPLTAAGELVDGDIAVQTRQVFDNLKAVLDAAGSGFGKAVKVNVYLADMNDFPEMNEVYAQVFGDHKPARATVQVARLPKDVAIEIDLVAVI